MKPQAYAAFAALILNVVAASTAAGQNVVPPASPPGVIQQFVYGAGQAQSSFCIQSGNDQHYTHKGDKPLALAGPVIVTALGAQRLTVTFSSDKVVLTGQPEATAPATVLATVTLDQWTLSMSVGNGSTVLSDAKGNSLSIASAAFVIQTAAPATTNLYNANPYYYQEPKGDDNPEYPGWRTWLLRYVR